MKGGALSAVSPETFGVDGYGREILTSSGPTQLSYEGESITGDTDQSLFTHFLVEGLKTGQAAPDDKEITVEQLYNYAHDQVVGVTSKMVPECSVARGQGRFVIAKNPHPTPKARPLPEEIKAALKDENPLTREGAVRALGRWRKNGEAEKVMAAQAALEALEENEKHIDVLQAVDAVLGRVPPPPKKEETVLFDVPEKSDAVPSNKFWLKLAAFAVLFVVIILMDNHRRESDRLERRAGQEASEAKRLEKEAERNIQAALAEKMAKKAEEARRKKAGTVFRDTLLRGGQGPEMVVIPAGRFQMGDLQGGGEAVEKPVHGVTIQKSFAMGKYEVTFEEYDLFATATGRTKPKDLGWGRKKRPVIHVSWKDAKTYVQWLSEQTGASYRLSSEAEWEYAARAGEDTATPGGMKSVAIRQIAMAVAVRGIISRRLPFLPFKRMPLGWMIPLVMSGNGQQIAGVTVTDKPLRMERPGERKTAAIAGFVCCAAVRGATIRATFVRRTAAGASRFSGPPLTVFASPGL